MMLAESTTWEAYEETAVDASSVIGLVRQLIPSNHDANQDQALSKREEAGCMLWDLSANRPLAQVMVDNHTVDVAETIIISELGNCTGTSSEGAMVPATSSCRIIEVCIGILGNLCTYDELAMRIKDSEGLLTLLTGPVLCEMDDNASLAELCRLFSIALRKQGWQAWFQHLSRAAAVQQLVWMANNTLDPLLLERCLDAIVAVLHAEGRHVQVSSSSHTEGDEEADSKQNNSHAAAATAAAAASRKGGSQHPAAAGHQAAGTMQQDVAAGAAVPPAGAAAGAAGQRQAKGCADSGNPGATVLSSEPTVTPVTQAFLAAGLMDLLQSLLSNALEQLQAVQAQQERMFVDEEPQQDSTTTHTAEGTGPHAPVVHVSEDALDAVLRLIEELAASSGGLHALAARGGFIPQLLQLLQLTESLKVLESLVIVLMDLHFMAVPELAADMASIQRLQWLVTELDEQQEQVRDAIWFLIAAALRRIASMHAKGNPSPARHPSVAEIIEQQAATATTTAGAAAAFEAASLVSAAVAMRQAGESPEAVAAAAAAMGPADGAVQLPEWVEGAVAQASEKMTAGGHGQEPAELVQQLHQHAAADAPAGAPAAAPAAAGNAAGARAAPAASHSAGAADTSTSGTAPQQATLTTQVVEGLLALPVGNGSLQYALTAARAALSLLEGSSTATTPAAPAAPAAPHRNNAASENAPQDDDTARSKRQRMDQSGFWDAAWQHGANLDASDRLIAALKAHCRALEEALSAGKDH